MAIIDGLVGHRLLLTGVVFTASKHSNPTRSTLPDLSTCSHSLFSNQPATQTAYALSQTLIGGSEEGSMAGWIVEGYGRPSIIEMERGELYTDKKMS